MSKTAELTSQDAQYKAQAQSHLAETLRILRHLSAEREREQHRRVARPTLVSEVKAILHGA